MLRDGRHVTTESASKLTRQDVVRHMVGRHLEVMAKSAGIDRPRGAKVLSVEHVMTGEIVKNMSCSIYAGEITCMAGLIGSGRTEVMKIVAGALKRNLLWGGNLYRDGRPVRYRVPAQSSRERERGDRRHLVIPAGGPELCRPGSRRPAGRVVKGLSVAEATEEKIVFAAAH